MNDKYWEGENETGKKQGEGKKEKKRTKGDKWHILRRGKMRQQKKEVRKEGKMRTFLDKMEN